MIMFRPFSKKSLLFLLLAAFVFPGIAGATDTTYNFLFDTGWTSPLQTTTYPLGTPIHVSGPWKLPPDWRGNIYVYQDGTQMTGNYTVTGPSGTVNGVGKNIIPITNKGGGTEIVGTFDMDIGPQPSGNHQIYVSFTGGTTCAINSIPPTGVPMCAIDTVDPDVNFIPSKGWLLSGNMTQPTYTVGPPAFPVMTVTPDPLLDFGDVNGQTDRDFTITNSGGQTLSGQVTGISAPFYCQPSCVYSVPSLSSVTMTIRFAPTGAPALYSQPISFSCAGSTLPCQPLAAYARTVRANFTNTLQPPQVSVCGTPPCSIDFGTVDLLTSYTKTVTVKNIGDGQLVGTIALPGTGEYSCVGSCSYTLWGGDSKTITIKFTPLTALPPTRTDVATFSGGTSQDLTIKSVINTVPILSVNFKKPTDPIQSSSFVATNSNTCQDLAWYVLRIQNEGAGTLSNVGMPITASAGDPIQIAAAPTDQLPGFSCVANCTYSGLTNASPDWFATVRFCAKGAYDDGLLHTTTIEFKNTLGAGQTNAGSVFIKLNAQANNNPIPNYTSPVTGIPGTGVFLPTGSSPFLEYGNVLVNTTSKLTFTLKNTGAGILSGTLGPSSNPAFVCSSANCATPYSLPNDGSSVTFEFSFTPTAVQPYTGTVIIGPQSGTATLHGTGAQPTFELETDILPSNQYSATSVAAPISTIDASNDTSYVGYQVTSNSPVFSIYTDLDQNPATGYQGGEFMIQTDSITTTYGRLYRYYGLGSGLGAGLGGYNFMGNIYTYGGRSSSGGWIDVLRSALLYPRILNVKASLGSTGSVSPPIITQQIANSVRTTYATPGTALDFGVTLFGSVNQNKSLDFFAINRKNVGTVNYTIDMSAAPDFKCLAACTGTFSGGVSGYTSYPKLEFHPLTEGDKVEPVTVTYDLNLGTGPTSFTFYVHGNSNMTGIGLDVPLIRLVPDTFLEMGTVAQGARQDVDLAIYNDGQEDLHVVKIWASQVGNNAINTTHFGCLSDAYTAPDNCNPTVVAGGSRIIKVTFQPQTGTGDLYADLNFLSDAFNSPTTPVELHGKATVASIITILLQGSDFGSVVIHKKKLQNVTIQNTGTGDFGSGTIVFTGPFKCVASEYGLDGSGNCKYTLGAGGSTTITIEFAPIVIGPQSGTMELSGLAGVPMPPVTGVGISPYIKYIEK